MIKGIKNKIFLVLIILIISTLMGCQATEESAPSGQLKEPLVIGAAASLNEAFTELSKQFEKNNPQWKVEFNFASSGNLKTSILQGAPIDVFASAAEKQMDELIIAEKIDEQSVELFAKNQLVLIVPKGSPVNTLEELFSLDRIAIGEPSSVPAGQYAKESLENLGYWMENEGSFIFAKDVRQVLFYVERNEVDGGFVYGTDALKGEDVKIVTTMPEESYTQILYPIGIVSDSQHYAGAMKWIELILSEEGQRVLSKYGFKEL